ncbi:phosphomannomutase [Microvirga subterranea]|uniref:Phosphomannomutase n=1 Tax=Microvirga subterranea TaxID=186651 RepID=A0A370HJC7_9HYPH|nr:phosphomannomutase [Microvirga subterranea]RDI58527.1 phosphomannomutase [Microvirga subterranea]
MGGNDTNRVQEAGASSLKFGTSGLRGLAVELAGLPAYAYARAFAEVLKKDGAGAESQGRILIGQDLRESSPTIARLCAAGLQDAGSEPINCGPLPTPALALHAMRLGLPAIMVTGSHIPEDRNGLKFYRAQGEINKQDETRILASHAELGVQSLPDAAKSMSMPAVDEAALSAYKARYLDYFGSQALRGLTVGVYQHSSVGRDVMVEILESLGARPVPLGRATSFIPVDTEALRPEDEILARTWAGEQALDAIVSTDGDADRPLVADGAGVFLRGDLLAAITARYLGADTIVTPVTSNSALEASGTFANIIRTKVGSPYVIEGMTEAARFGGRVVVGFEANGGVLLGSSVRHRDRMLAALPTRDAMLPILCALAQVKASERPLADLAAGFGFKAAASNRLKDVSTEKSAAFMTRLKQDRAFLEALLSPVADIAVVDGRDGLRVSLANAEVVHFRASGNAPELRVYVEAATQARAEDLLTWGLRIAEQHVRHG